MIDWLLTVPPIVASVLYHGGDFTGDGNRLRLFAGLDHQVHANGLPNLHEHAAVLQGLKAFGFRPHCERAGVQIVGDVLSGAIGGQGARDAAGHVDYGYRGACDGASALVEHRALNRALIRLRKEIGANEKQRDSEARQRKGSLHTSPSTCIADQKNTPVSLQT